MCVPAFDKQEMLHKISLDRNVGQEQALYNVQIGTQFLGKKYQFDFTTHCVTLRNIKNEWCQCQRKGRVRLFDIEYSFSI